MVLDIQGDLTSRTVENVYNTIHDSYVPGDAVEISIDSRGGYINVAVSVMTVLKYLQMVGSHITIHNTGPVMSAATIIWLTCNERIWDPQFDFLIHNPYMEGISGDADDLLEQAVELVDVEEDIRQLYSAISGKTTDEVEALMAQSRPMTVEELKEWNFITDLKK